jgi:protein-disulfide isomerase
MRRLQFMLACLPRGKLHHHGTRGCRRGFAKLGTTHRSGEMLSVFRNNMRLWISAAAITLVLLVVNAGGSVLARPAQTPSKGAAPSQTKPPTPPKAKSAAPATTKASAADIAKAKSLGSKNAPILVELFSDFQCPQCKNFYLGASRRLLEDYASAGKVYFVHHDFPLAIPEHVHSEEAARWANAAAAIGKFHEVEAALYKNQDSWGATGRINDQVAAVLSPADFKRVQALVENSEVKAAIQHDKDLGNSRNVNSTPSVFVTHNGHTEALPYSGVSYNLFKPYLDYLLQH